MDSSVKHPMKFKGDGQLSGRFQNKNTNHKNLYKSKSGAPFKPNFNKFSNNNFKPQANHQSKFDCNGPIIQKGKNAAPDCIPLRRRAPPPLSKQLERAPPIDKSYRDPRFDDLSGKLDQEAFNQNYQFLKKIAKKERKALKNELEKTEDKGEKERIKQSLQTIDSKRRETWKNKLELSMKKKHKKDAIEALNKGQIPFFKKNSQLKLENMAKKFQELKKENRLDKYLEKKEKKIRAKEIFNK